MRRCSNLLFAAAALLLAAPLSAQDGPAPSAAGARPQVALMGTVPIYWGEAEGFADLLSGDAPSHWARSVIARHAEPVPLDYLSAEALAPYRYLLMAQPRGLTGEENVALDAWVRGGGRLLLFADPLMTGESRFHLGDRRRPQDVALLSPILAHWGLELHFDAAQDDGPATVDHFGSAIPVNMRGSFSANGEKTGCAIPGDGLLAHCAIGTGEALLVADAALLDITGPWPGAEPALDSLIGHIFPGLAGENGEIAGRVASPMRDGAGSGATAPKTAPLGHADSQEGHAH
ncbi:ABC transporter [Erythrobacter arachoides]|uniref:ABC transporter n=1 Tax=Aurantiacibacter arachoides TaxID=1850444 RepID=A0A844ZZY4_9SPHN|nr:ABC transporter [Aurantiacibacter arachoides]MXO92476.1 ABC transporter [Aurantiacibacter arachoides]GGD56881.1 hypothetical protein GCM10011411_16130 [Aurantiacibacter arachoides]